MNEALRLFLQALPDCHYGTVSGREAGEAGRPEIIERFIVLEGLDGSGSSTQARLLEQYFRSRNLACQRSAEPGDGPSGRRIRRILRGETSVGVDERAGRSELARYFAADRSEHIRGPEGVLTQCRAGIWCISERYLFSSLVYQGLDAQSGMSEIWALNRGFPLPRHLFYLDIAAAAAEQRIALREASGGREIFEREEFLAQVRQAYRALLAHFRRIAPAMRIHLLDAGQSPKQVRQQILSRLAHVDSNFDLRSYP